MSSYPSIVGVRNASSAGISSLNGSSIETFLGPSALIPKVHPLAFPTKVLVKWVVLAAPPDGEIWLGFF